MKCDKHFKLMGKLEIVLANGSILKSALNKYEYLCVTPLLQAGVTIRESVNKRRSSIIKLVDGNSLRGYIDEQMSEIYKYRNASETMHGRALNIVRNGNSKSGCSTVIEKPFFIRGFNGAALSRNGVKLDIASNTKKFGIAAFRIDLESSLHTECSNPTVVLVENLESFMYIEKVIPCVDVAIWYSGNIDANLYGIFKWDGFNKSKVLISPDYDKVGLNNYLSLRKALYNSLVSASLFIPNNLEELMISYSNKKLHTDQNFSDNLNKFVSFANTYSDDKLMRVLQLMVKYGGLEQEAIQLNI